MDANMLEFGSKELRWEIVMNFVVFGEVAA